MHGVLDVQNNSVSGARARGQPNRRVDSYVVTLIGFAWLLGAFFAVRAAIAQAVDGAGSRIHEHAGAVDDFGVLRGGHGNFDDVNAEQRGVRILVRSFSRAAGQLFRLAHKRRAGNIDVDIFFVTRIENKRMRVRPAAGLHGGHLLRIANVGNVEDADAAEALFLGSRNLRPLVFILALVLVFVFFIGRRSRLRRKTLHAAVDASVRHLDG